MGQGGVGLITRPGSLQTCQHDNAGWMRQVVLLGVYLLAPGKRAYLRSLEDTQEALLQHR